MIENPLFLIGPVLLPLVALFFGPLFCGWLCPAGSFTELVGRLIPDRLKLTPSGRFRPAPVRYGVLAGMLLSPFLGGYVCCTFCNFTMMQNLVSAAFGDFVGMTAWASFTIATFFVWLVPLGLFVKGGRGWCNLLCPAGAVQGMFHAVGAKQSFGRAIRIDEESCSHCGKCAKECPGWAISRKQRVDYHACNLCRDCLYFCPNEAISYDTPAESFPPRRF